INQSTVFKVRKVWQTMAPVNWLVGAGVATACPVLLFLRVRLFVENKEIWIEPQIQHGSHHDKIQAYVKVERYRRAARLDQGAAIDLCD
ncbi:hypothetical protein, partial [Pseudomonas synxantha]|uniref:hypothetical protein n=1 Tax=Pseudomonas synxantha TaxID=47883 RepID=UPI001C3F914F